MPIASLLLGLLAAAPGDAGRPGTVESLAQAASAQLLAARLDGPYALQVDAPRAVLAAAFTAVVSRGLPLVDATNAEVRGQVRLVLSLEGSSLVVRGSWTPTWVNFWAGSKPRVQSPVALPELRAEADATAVALATGAATPTVVFPLPAVPLALKVTALAQLPQVPAALACRDLDGDGKAEIAVLTPDAVLLLSPEGRVLARYDLKGEELSTTPGREPFGAMALNAKPATMVVLSARHAHGQTLAYEKGALHLTGRVETATLEGFTVRLARGLNVFAAITEPAPLPAGLQSISANHGVRLFGFSGGTVSATRADTAGPVASGAGAATALADFEGDGTPEVVVTSSEPYPAADVVSVLALPDVEAAQKQQGPLGAVVPLWRAQVPRGRALTAAGCDLNGDGKDEVVLGAWLDDGTGELSVVSGVKP